jgi:hypothetical protein
VVPGPDLAVHADLADAARDQLGVLRAEIEDQDLVVWILVIIGARALASKTAWRPSPSFSYAEFIE